MLSVEPTYSENENDGQLFFVGTYSTEGPYVPEANGRGIISCLLHTRTGKIDTVSACDAIVNASYLDRSLNSKRLFSVDDQFDQPGSVQAFACDEKGRLQPLASQGSRGTSTCHLSCDEEGYNVFAVSYLNGVLTHHQFDGETFTGNPDCIHYEGSGPNSNRQQAAHAHQAAISPGGRWLCVCDLGSDKIWIHRIKNGEFLRIEQTVDVPTGYGPRHLVWHPDGAKVYVFCELSAHLLVYRWDEQSGDMVQSGDLASLPDEFEGAPAGAAIRMHPSGRALYVSNRNHNSLTMFSVDERGGLEFETWFSTQGKTPRDFAIDSTGQWLLAANQNSDTIVPFRLDPNTGGPTGEAGPPYPCGTPACLLF